MHGGGAAVYQLVKERCFLCKTGEVLRGGGQIFAARWEEWGFSRGFWGEIFRDFFAGWWRKLINGAQRALFD
jgi:hypothetical protein